MILCTQSGIWSATWPDNNGDDHDMLSYFTVMSRGGVSHVNDRPNAASKMIIWNSGISQIMFRGSNFAIVDWISASSV